MANCDLSTVNTNPFASDATAAATAMTATEMAAGLSCGQLSIHNINWLFGQLFGAVSSLVTCVSSICAIFDDPATAATNGELAELQDLAGNTTGYLIV